MGLIFLLLVFAVLILGVLALIKSIWGQETVARTVGTAKGILGCGLGLVAWIIISILIFVCPWVAKLMGQTQIGLLMRMIGCCLALALLIPSLVSGLRDALKEKQKEKAKNDHWAGVYEERRHQRYLADSAAAKLKVALDQINDEACKDLRSNQYWDAGLPLLVAAFADSDLNRRLAAIHGLRHVFDADRYERARTGVRDEYNTPVEDYNSAGGLVEFLLHLDACARDESQDKRIRIAILLMAGNAKYQLLSSASYMLLRDPDHDVRAAACRAVRQLMTAESAPEFYQSFFDDLLKTFDSLSDRLTEEALFTTTYLAGFGVMTSADFSGVMMIMQKIASDPKRSAAVHDRADLAIEALKNAQRNQRVERESAR